MHNDTRVSVSRDRSFRSPPEIGHDPPKQAVTSYRNDRSRLSEMTGHDEPKYAYYVWKAKYAGMEVSQLRHLKDVESELERLKRMYADLALEHHALKDVLSRKG